MRCRWRDGRIEYGVFSLPGRRAVSASVYDLESTRIDQRHIGSGGDMDAYGRIGRLYLVTPTGADDVPLELSFIHLHHSPESILFKFAYTKFMRGEQQRLLPFEYLRFPSCTTRGRH